MASLTSGWFKHLWMRVLVLLTLGLLWILLSLFGIGLDFRSDFSLRHWQSTLCFSQVADLYWLTDCMCVHPFYLIWILDFYLGHEDYALRWGTVLVFRFSDGVLTLSYFIEIWFDWVRWDLTVVKSTSVSHSVTHISLASSSCHIASLEVEVKTKAWKCWEN